MTPSDAEHTKAYRYDDLARPCPVLVVGEDNPQSADPREALYPYPVGCAGYNYAENIANVGSSHHLATWRTNLCNPTWNKKQAELRALDLVIAEGVPWRTIVMLGRKVAGAFAGALSAYNPPLKFAPFTITRVLHRVRECPTPTAADLDWIQLVSLPHPSGRCREWGNPVNVHRARALLAAAAPGWYGECNT